MITKKTIEITPNKIINAARRKQYCDKCKYLTAGITGVKICTRVIAEDYPLKKDRKYYNINIINRNLDCRFYKRGRAKKVKKPWWRKK